MIKTERLQAEEVEPTPSSAWLMGAAAWFVPGLGHVLLGRWVRASLMGGVVWLSFVLGLAMGGHMVSPFNVEGSLVLLQVPPMIANLGTGVLYIVFWLLGIGFAANPEQAAGVTYEYGYMLLLIAGLLNYLNMLDAFDIAAGRKS